MAETQQNIFEEAAENPKELLEKRKGLYLMINAIAKLANQYEEKNSGLFVEKTEDPIMKATEEIIEKKVRIFENKEKYEEFVKELNKEDEAPPEEAPAKKKKSAK